MANLPWDDAAKYFAKRFAKELKKAKGPSSRLTSKPSSNVISGGASRSKPKVKTAAQIKKSVGKTKVVNGKLNVVRGEYLKSTRSVRETTQGSRAGNFPSSPYNKIGPELPIGKRNFKTQSPKNAKSVGEGVTAAKTMKTKKVINTPAKPKKTYLKTKDREVTLSPTEQRAAEREATRIIRRAGDKPISNPQPTSGRRPVGRPAPSSTTASKRTRGMSKDKGNNSRGKFEADKTKSEIADDRKQFGKGQSLPKKKSVPAKKAPAKKGAKPKRKAKPKPEPTSRYKTDTGSQMKRLRSAVNNADTPAAKRAANKARIEWLKKNGYKP